MLTSDFQFSAAVTKLQSLLSHDYTVTVRYQILENPITWPNHYCIFGALVRAHLHWIHIVYIDL